MDEDPQDALLKWLTERVSQLGGQDIPTEMVEYIMSFTDISDLEEYLEDLFSSNGIESTAESRHSLATDFISKKEKIPPSSKKSNAKSKSKSKKNKDDEDPRTVFQKVVQNVYFHEDDNPTVSTFHPTPHPASNPIAAALTTSSSKDDKTKSLQAKSRTGQEFRYIPKGEREKTSSASSASSMGFNTNDDEDDFPSFSKPKPRSKSNNNFVNTGDMCLSMWQPWGSLLVYGIKRVEGRSWYSDHRGRLWIASASKKAEVEEIDSVEAEYKDSPVVGHLPFPKVYPLSALLGCVDVVDVLTHDEYVEKFPDENREDNNSPYVFVCENPRKLLMPIPISGQHKIWKIDQDILATAKAALGIK